MGAGSSVDSSKLIHLEIDGRKEKVSSLNIFNLKKQTLNNTKTKQKKNERYLFLQSEIGLLFLRFFFFFLNLFVPSSRLVSFPVTLNEFKFYSLLFSTSSSFSLSWSQIFRADLKQNLIGDKNSNYCSLTRSDQTGLYITFLCSDLLT